MLEIARDVGPTVLQKHLLTSNPPHHRTLLSTLAMSQAFPSAAVSSQEFSAGLLGKLKEFERTAEDGEMLRLTHLRRRAIQRELLDGTEPKDTF